MDYKMLKKLILNISKKKIIIALALLLCQSLFLSTSSFAEEPQITITPTVSKSNYRAGDTVLVALHVQIPQHYHLYDNPLGPGIGKPLNYRVEGDAPIDWSVLLKPESKRFTPEVGDWVNAYEGDVHFFLRGIVRGAATSGSYTSSVIVNGLMCDRACLPVSVTKEFTVAISENGTLQDHFKDNDNIQKQLTKAVVEQKPDTTMSAAVSLQNSGSLLNLDLGKLKSVEQPKTYVWDYAPQNAKEELSIFLAIFFGFIAGIILNAMPCVLPVLGIKILSFAQGASSSRKTAVVHSLAFSSGVLLVFLLLATLASFANLSWGRQFQDPRALIAIITIIVVFALGLFDIYVITVPGSLAGKGSSKSGMLDDFLKGIFATILATPCSGPFLGAVLAWSMTQSAQVVYIVYASIGLGMSFPYILLSSIPRLSRIIPRPGPWMNDFKMVLGFFLIGFAVYLMIGLPQDLLIPTIMFCVLISFAVVIYTKIAPWGSAFSRKMLSLCISLIIVSASFYLSFMVVYPSFSRDAAATISNEESGKVWKEFNPDSLVEAHKQGRPVILDFTANWCMNCQYNYIMVLTKKEIINEIEKKNILAMKADMTTSNPMMDSLLHKLGSQSIPFLAIFPGDKPKEPIVMRDVLRVGQVKKVLEKL